MQNDAVDDVVNYILDLLHYDVSDFVIDEIEQDVEEILEKYLTLEEV